MSEFWTTQWYLTGNVPHRKCYIPQFFKRDSIIKIWKHMYVLSYFFSQSAKNSSEFGRSTVFLLVSFLVAWLKVSKSRKQFLKSSIFQNLTQKIWRITALCTSGQESFKFLRSNFGKLMISKIAFKIYWPLDYTE